MMMSSTPDSNNLSRKPTGITNSTTTTTQTSSGNRKSITSSSSSSPKPTDHHNQQLLQAAALKCPRCDSPNTKFCYYNNYSLTQPRHFCKTCRRYWTKGGALRNVPIGGGCRKSKKTKSSSSSLSFSSSNKLQQEEYSFDTTTDGFKLFHHGGLISPSFDQFGRIPFSRLTSNSSSSSISTNGLFNNNNNNHQLVSFGDLSSNNSTTPAANTTSSSAINPCFNMEASVSSGSLMGFNHHLGLGSSSSILFKQGENTTTTTTELFNGGGGGGLAHHHHHHQDMGSMNANHHHHHHHNSSNLASTMESLSCINQELHWKLQQERLAMLFGGDNNIIHHQNNKEIISSTSVSSVSGDLLENQQTQKPLPISFQNLDISKQELVIGNPSKKGGVCSNINATTNDQWLFDQNSYNSPIPGHYYHYQQ